MTSTLSSKGGESPDERSAIAFLPAAGWTVAVGLLVDVGVQTTDKLRPGAAEDIVNLTACYLLAYSLIMFLAVRVHERDVSLRRVFALRSASPLVAVLSCGIGASLYPGLSRLSDLVARVYPPSPEELDMMAKLLGSGSLGRIAMFLHLVVLMPVVEECFFRGLLYGGLRKGRPAWLALIATSVYFTLCRADPRSLPSLLVLAMFLGWLRERSGSVIPALLAHASFFAVAIVPMLLSSEPNAEVTYSLTWVTGGLLTTALGALIVLTLTRSVSVHSHGG